MRRNNMPCGILDVFDLDPHLIQDSLGPPDLASQTAPRSIQPFLHSSRHTVPIIYNERPFPQNCPFAWGDLNSHLIHDSLFPCKHTTQTASQSVQPFLHKIPQSVPILYNGPPVPPPSKFSLPKTCGPRLIHGYLGPPIVLKAKTASRSFQSFLQGLLL